ncbi:MAG: hypothetical protein AB7O26_12115, partial [Planctomycetaceae bacterium]
FLLPPIRIESEGSVVISGPAGSQPLIVLAPDPEDTTPPVVEVAGGTLVLSGVHIAAIGAQFSGNETQRLFSSRGGDLTVRNCSVTLLGKRAGPTAAFTFNSTETRAGRGPKVLFENVFVRGENLTAIDFNLPATDFLASNCLFVSGPAPVMQLTNGRPSAAGQSSAIAKQTVIPVSMSQNVDREAGLTPPASPRNFHFFSSALSSNGSAFEFTGGDAKPTGTNVQILNSVVGSGTGAPETSLVKLIGWKDDIGDGMSRSAPGFLKWSIENSQILGWKTLLQKDQGAKKTAADPLAWQQMWGKPVDLVQFQPEVWPVEKISSIAALEAKKLDASLPTSGSTKATDGGKPGCDFARLTTPATEIVDRAVAIAERPALPAEFATGIATGEKRIIDLNDRTVDLGKIISTEEWPDGTVFEISGSGPKSSSPIRVQGKSFRIEFNSEAHSSLSVQLAEPRGDKSAAGDSFISVTGGSVELVNANFKIPLTTRQQQVAWMLSVDDGSFAVRNCSLVGQLLENPGFEGLIRWKRTANSAEKSEVPGKYEQYGYVSQSYLFSRGPIVTIDSNDRGLLLEQSLMVTPDRILNVQLPTADVRCAIEISHCTLAAGRAFVNVEGAAAGSNTQSPLRMFVGQSAFLSALPAEGATPPVVLAYAGNAQQDGRMEWWETSTGYSQQIGPFQVNSSAPNESSATTIARVDWPKVWGAAHVVRPLLDDDGVLLAKSIPKITEIEAEDFRLLPNSKGMTWTETGNAIGVDFDSLPPLALKGGAAKPVAKPTPTKSETKTKSTGKRPSF